MDSKHTKKYISMNRVLVHDLSKEINPIYVDVLESQIKIMTNALHFYAADKTYTETWTSSWGDLTNAIEEDEGKVATRALKECFGEDYEKK